MGRPRRPLTEVERTEACPLCEARPGQRCTNPNGTVYSGICHSARNELAARRAGRGKFSTEGIHERTLSEVEPGTPVVTRDAFGNMRPKIAVTTVVAGHDFLVVWVAREEEVEAARRESRDPDALPWPAEDVWVPGCEPREDGDLA